MFQSVQREAQTMMMAVSWARVICLPLLPLPHLNLLTVLCGGNPYSPHLQMRKTRHGEAKYLPRSIQLRALQPTSGRIRNPLCTFYYYVCPLGWGWRVVRGAVKGVPELYKECDAYRSLLLLRQVSLSSVFCRQWLMDLLKRCGDEAWTRPAGFTSQAPTSTVSS